MKHAPRLPINLQVLCFLDTLTYTERRRLPVIVPHWYDLARVQRIAKPARQVIPFAPIAQETAA